jgi:hypothetical protein
MFYFLMQYCDPAFGLCFYTVSVLQGQSISCVLEPWFSDSIVAHQLFLIQAFITFPSFFPFISRPIRAPTPEFHHTNKQILYPV